MIVVVVLFLAAYPASDFQFECLVLWRKMEYPMKSSIGVLIVVVILQKRKYCTVFSIGIRMMDVFSIMKESRLFETGGKFFKASVEMGFCICRLGRFAILTIHSLHTIFLLGGMKQDEKKKQ